MREIDHIVYAVDDLEKGMLHIQELTGVSPVYGGRHLSKGTHNALINTGKGSYLEIISVDPENLEIKSNRWMGVDRINRPMIMRWCLKSKDLLLDQKVLKANDRRMGEIVEGSRMTQQGELLEWKMILPLAEPAVEIIPFMVDWSKSTHHPSDQLEDECQLIDIMLSHPNPTPLNKVLLGLDSKSKVTQGSAPSINIKLFTPKGEVIL